MQVAELCRMSTCLVLGLVLVMTLRGACFAMRPSYSIQRYYSNYHALTRLYSSNLEKVEETQRNLLKEYKGNAIR